MVKQIALKFLFQLLYSQMDLSREYCVTLVNFSTCIFQGIFRDTASNSRFVMNSSYSCNYLVSKNKEHFAKKKKKKKKNEKENRAF